MIVAPTMMREGDLDAMDRWLAPTDELDRYHGSAKAPFSLPAEGAPTRPLAGPRRKLPLP